MTMKIDEFSLSFNGTLSSCEITQFINIGFNLSPSSASGVGFFVTERALELIDNTRTLQLIDKTRSLVLI